MTDSQPPSRGPNGEPSSADLADDRNDPARAEEIDSMHHARSPEADPPIPTRPRAPLGPWLWISALVALVLVLGIAALVAQLN